MTLPIQTLRELARSCAVSGGMANVTAEELTELLDAYEAREAFDTPRMRELFALEGERTDFVGVLRRRDAALLAERERVIAAWRKVYLERFPRNGTYHDADQVEALIREELER